MLVGRLGEEGLLRQLRSLFAVTAEAVPVGIGDDAAVIDHIPGNQMVWTTDLLLEGIHFEKHWQTPKQLGRRCLAVNLSDIAAMAALPRYALLSIACPKDAEVELIMELSRGFCDLALEEKVAVIGGDTTASREGLVLSVTAGGVSPTGAALLRSGAKPGDAILVSGYLGSAAGGVKLLKKSIQNGYPSLRQAFVSPEAQVTLAQEALRAGATAMTDISDGLASDLRHICQESGVGAVIDHDRLPVHPELIQACEEFGWDLDALILAGGEDYGLLFTLPGGRAGAAAAGIAMKTDRPVAVIGEILAKPEITISCELGRENRLPEHGFDHFLQP